MLSVFVPEIRRDIKLVEVADRIGILVGEVINVGARTLSSADFVDTPTLSSCPDWSESLFGVPMIGDRVVGFDIRLLDLETLFDEDPAANMPRSIIEEAVAPALDILRPGEMELRLRPEAGRWSRLFIKLFLLGIFDGELLALLTTCNNPFS